MEGKGNADVKGFIVSNHEILSTIPNGIGNFFVNLEVFYWNQGNISRIDSGNFAAFPNLLYTEAPRDLFPRQRT